MKTITKKEFETEVLKATTLVLVDFYTNDCSPCRIIAPVLEEIERESAGKLKLVKVDAVAEQDLTLTWRVSTVPTLLLFKAGTVVGQRVGAPTKKALLQWIADSAR